MVELGAKSVTGLMAAMLIVKGRLDPEAKLSTYVPELTGNPFGDVTREKNLDMKVAAAYSLGASIRFGIVWCCWDYPAPSGRARQHP